ncbi:MAG: hypothetical protein WDM96_12625 [Lacunisphaera sp.]
MNHYCTYFDSGFLPQGVALWRSLAAHDPLAVLWVLALDETVVRLLPALGEERLRVVSLGELEAADPELVAVKGTRTRVEYYFTVSPCWPATPVAHATRNRTSCVSRRDLFFFAAPDPIWAMLDQGSVLTGLHRFPAYLAHYERHGRYNVGVLGWKRDANGLACLEWWRARCLEWCYDRLEDGRYADQKYLEEWPRLVAGVVENTHPGVNLAPWNWMNHRYAFADGSVQADGQPLVVFHFARFRALAGDWWWQSGQLDYGVMPWVLRQALYGRYHRALTETAAEIRRVAPGWQPVKPSRRLGRSFWRGLPPRIVFGSDWLRVGGWFVSGRLGLGGYSGRVLARLRTIFLRR